MPPIPGIPPIPPMSGIPPSAPGGGPAATPGGAGGSGVVIFSAPQGTWVASGVWNMQDQYIYKTDGNWQ